MQRPIAGFHRDEAADWVAELACGHGQHVRHAPPFHERPWVESEEGRGARLGTTLDCRRCDRRELPDGFAAYQRTPSFTEATVPKGLLADHSTKPGVWALIHVERGEVDYHLHAPFHERQRLTPAAPGVVLPEVEHHVACPGPAAFHVEFWRAPR